MYERVYASRNKWKRERSRKSRRHVSSNASQIPKICTTTNWTYLPVTPVPPPTFNPSPCNPNVQFNPHTQTPSYIQPSSHPYTVLRLIRTGRTSRQSLLAFIDECLDFHTFNSTYLHSRSSLYSFQYFLTNIQSTCIIALEIKQFTSWFQSNHIELVFRRIQFGNCVQEFLYQNTLVTSHIIKTNARAPQEHAAQCNDEQKERQEQ